MTASDTVVILVQHHSASDSERHAPLQIVTGDPHRIAGQPGEHMSFHAVYELLRSWSGLVLEQE
ncbi:hypothetical protein [Pseudoduganella lutea]|uniref:Uncharacterized protein n=1 Tax=Pseudoduganella lutea TaxID=321985 RepID=A0A4P6L3J8_9BURK|nr:hypothetical protein [Pseudoduganella lutea]QBE65855.1 hypothetical protein EWM63_25115 [Pseudoduganella lutea]